MAFPNSRVALAIGLGLLLAPVKLLYSFFPFFNVVDLAAFGLLGAALARRSDRWALTAILISLPSVILAAYFVTRLGLGQLRQGIGIGWLISLFAMPMAALLGAYLRRPRASSGAAA
jgi:hypothetical protein